MSKGYLYLTVFAGLFILMPNARAQEAVSADVIKDALAFYCPAARQGEGVAQYEVGRIYAAQPGTPEKDTIRRDIAAAMMWLDMAHINKVQEARALRRHLGKTARPQDFALYAQFTRMEIDAPCTWEEIYPPPLKRGEGE